VFWSGSQTIGRLKGKTGEIEPHQKNQESGRAYDDSSTRFRVGRPDVRLADREKWNKEHGDSTNGTYQASGRRPPLARERRARTSDLPPRPAGCYPAPAVAHPRTGGRRFDDPRLPRQRPPPAPERRARTSELPPRAAGCYPAPA
jgi:hypothetical protein